MGRRKFFPIFQTVVFAKKPHGYLHLQPIPFAYLNQELFMLNSAISVIENVTATSCLP